MIKMEFYLIKGSDLTRTRKKKHENEVSEFDETLTFLYESRKCVGVK